MKTYFLILTALTIGCASALAVSDEDFQKMQQQMQQQSQQIQDLQKAHQDDRQEIQQLKEQQGVTQKTTTETQQKAEAAQKKAEEAQQTAASAEASAKTPAATGPDALQNFMVVGDAEFQFAKTEGQHSGFVLADFAPIFLFRATDKVLFEAGFDVVLQNGSNPLGTHDSGSGNSVSLSFGTLDYLFNDYVTVVAGDMLLPLGTYSERGAGWLNKMPDSPLPRDVLPGAGVGLQLRGAMPVGDSGQAVTYAVYGVNGPSSSDGTATSGQLVTGLDPPAAWRKRSVVGALDPGIDILAFDFEIRGEVQSAVEHERRPQFVVHVVPRAGLAGDTEFHVRMGLPREEPADTTARAR